MKKVLVVDPSKTFGNFLKYVLLRLGYDVTHVVSPREALENMEKILPSLITSEVHMKDIDGMEFCRRLKEADRSPEIPVAIISVDGTAETRLLAQQAGCVEYLTKPVTFRTIHELMERHLSYSHKRQNIRAQMVLKVLVIDGADETEMRSVTISEGGIYLCTDHPAEVGSRLDMKLPLPGLMSPLSLRGEVIYSVKKNGQDIVAGMGVKFIGLDDNTVTLLRHYMESYLSDFLPRPPEE